MRTNRAGYSRLVLLKLPQAARYLKNQIAADKALGVLFAPLGGAELFRDELLRASVWACFFEESTLPGSAAEFSERLRDRRGELADQLSSMQLELREILQARHGLIGALDAATSPAFVDAVADIRAQVAELVPPAVLTVTPSDRLGDIPRYLEAALYRLENLQGKVKKDLEFIDSLRGFRQRIDRLAEELGRESADWQQLRYFLEELRVGLFAERLGVKEKASPKRLNRRLEALEREHGLI
jgi:ATP-dependent helicase HrpA